MKSKPFRLEDRIDIEKTAKRFEVSTGNVKEAIQRVLEERGEVTLSVTRRNQELTQYIRSVYDEQAKSFNFKDMVHMLAVFHTELLSRAIVSPERFGKEGAKIGADISKFVYPKETATVTRKLPDGETRDQILARVLSRLGEQNLLPPGQNSEPQTPNTPDHKETNPLSQSHEPSAPLSEPEPHIPGDGDLLDEA